MKLNLLTLTWNKLDKLTRLKDSLIPALKGINYEWHIKSNGCKDGTVETVSEWGKNIHAHAYKDNLQNFSEGMNYIFDIVSPSNNDLVLLLNNDVVFGDNSSIKKMLELLQQPNVGVVGAKLLYTGTNKIQHAGVVFHRHGLPFNFRSGELDTEEASKNRYFQAITGAVMLMRAKDYKSIHKNNKSGIDGLDEKLVWCYDDVDACISIINQDKKIIYCGETNIFHDESASLKSNPINKLFFKHNMKYFLDKWKGKYSIDADKYIVNPKFNLV